MENIEKLRYVYEADIFLEIMYSDSQDIKLLLDEIKAKLRNNRVPDNQEYIEYSIDLYLQNKVLVNRYINNFGTVKYFIDKYNKEIDDVYIELHKLFIAYNIEYTKLIDYIFPQEYFAMTVGSSLTTIYFSTDPRFDFYNIYKGYDVITEAYDNLESTYQQIKTTINSFK